MARLKSQPFILLGINLDEDKAAAKKALAEDQIEGRDWWSAAAQSAQQTYKVRGIPALYLLDQNGVIRFKKVGAPDPATLEREINKLLAGNLTS